MKEYYSNFEFTYVFLVVFGTCYLSKYRQLDLDKKLIYVLFSVRSTINFLIFSNSKFSYPLIIFDISWVMFYFFSYSEFLN